MKKGVFAFILITTVFGCKSSKKLAKTEGAQTQAPTATTEATPVAKPSQLINLPVFIPISQLQKQLYDNFFAEHDGKYYPCEGKSDCRHLYSDLYLENPELKVKDDHISIKMHLAGHVNALIFHPDASGDIQLTAKPVVKNDTLFFENVTMEHSSQTFLLSIASKVFEKQIIKKIQDNAWYSFRPDLDKYTAEFQKQTPVKWESAVLLLSLKKIYLNSVFVQSAPYDGIIANFSAELVTEAPGYGQ